jgi:hypothetical protein
VAPAAFDASNNLIQNGSFERDFASWNYAGASIDPNTFTDGTRSGKLDCSRQQMADWRSNLYSATVGRTYKLIFDYKTSVGSTLSGPEVRHRFYSGTNWMGESQKNLELTNGQWVTVELTYTCPPGQDHYDLFFTTNRYNTTFKGIVWFDNIRVLQDDTTGDLYANGKVDFNDLQLFCLDWLNKDESLGANFNNDALVDNLDFSHFSQNWQTLVVEDTFADANTLIPSDPNNLPLWTIVDEGFKDAPSAWTIVNGELSEPSNIYGPYSSSLVDGRTGTYVYWSDPQAMTWADYEFHVSLRSADDDGTGVMFRYQDYRNYYKFEIDCQRPFRKLFKVKDGVETLLASTAVGYTKNVSVDIVVKVIGSRITVLMDGVDSFGPVTDADLPAGTIALYDWGCKGLYFDNFYARVKRLAPAAFDDVYEADAGQTLHAPSLLANDLSPQPMTAERLTAPAHGQITLRPDGTFDYTPDAGFGGKDRFTYRAVSAGSSDIANVTLKVDTPNSFSIVILPDIQFYSASYPEISACQASWIAANRDRLKLAFVLQEGDITDDRTISAQWQAGSDAMAILDAENVPYAIVCGNHDLPNAAPRDLTLFNTWFPVSRFSGKPHFGGVYEDGRSENSWHSFSAGGIDWLVFALEFGPRDAVLSWANGIIAAHPHHRVIVLTHGYMYSDDTRLGAGDSWNPNTYAYCGTYDTTCNDGDEMWTNFVKLHKGMTFVFSGHVLNDGAGRRVDAGDNGNLVYQMLANYQVNPVGGNGFLRIVKCFPESGNVTVESYSPYTGEYRTTDEHEFEYSGVDLSIP